MTRIALLAVALCSCTIDPVGDAPDEVGYTTMSCPASYLNTTPVAGQCCFQTQNYNDGSPGGATVFIRPSDNALIIRYRNPWGTGCKAQDGQSPCSGRSCYYGPNGFSAALIFPGTSTMVVTTSNGYYGPQCSVIDTHSQTGHYFSDVTGTFPTGQGCPGGDSGDSYWDY